MPGPDLAQLKKPIDAKEVTSGDAFGTRKNLKNNYLYRMAAAVLGIYGNSKQEAIYPVYTVDADGKKLEGSGHYTQCFAANELPPVNAFWSLTMYRLPDSLLVANPLDRYLLELAHAAEVQEGFRRWADSLHPERISRRGSGSELVACAEGTLHGDHLPRLYWPKAAVLLDGTWTAPPLTRVR